MSLKNLSKFKSVLEPKGVSTHASTTKVMTIPTSKRLDEFLKPTPSNVVDPYKALQRIDRHEYILSH